jgi:predicted NBD/HSP70 family sugar kinase
MRIGIDLGGSKIEGLVLDQNGGECARERMRRYNVEAHGRP